VVYGDDPIEGGDESLPYPDHYLTHYPATKAQAEQAVLAAHEPGVLHTVALRPHLIWGPGDPHLVPRLVERAKKGQIARVGDGTNRVSVAYVENAAHAHVLALDAIASPSSSAGGRAYFINEPEPVVLWDFLETILDGVGAPKPKKKLSFSAARKIGGAMELAYKTFGISDEPRMTRFVATQLATSHWFKVDRAREDLGFEPVVSVEEGSPACLRPTAEPG
jgi:nucleoside-diphosphate-sugar epimerase